MRRPVPLLFLVELKKKLYRLRLPERKIRFRSVIDSLLLSLRSERKIILSLLLVSASIFFSCLGQLVDTFNELTFWIEQLKLVRIDAREMAAAAAPLFGS